MIIVGRYFDSLTVTGKEIKEITVKGKTRPDMMKTS